jgi:hypothetical protein
MPEPRVLDPGLTALALRGRQEPEGHWLRVRAWERRRAWARVWWDAVLGVVVLGAAVGAWALALYLIGWR